MIMAKSWNSQTGWTSRFTI